MLLKDKLAEVLNQTSGEREIHAFLKEEPWLVWATFMNSGGHSRYVIPEFSLAGKYYADFVVIQSFSGGWNVAFIELEPVDEKLFIKDGSPSKRLRGAIKQIDDWKTFQECERASLCSGLADAARKQDILYPEYNLAREPWCVKMPLRDPKTYLCFEYFIVMGRRSEFDEDLIHVKSRFLPHHGVEILTYDRLFEVAENIEQQSERHKNRIIEKKDQDFLTQFTENPEQFSASGNPVTYKYPIELDIHGTHYKLQPNEREPGFVVDVLNKPYEIFEIRCQFRLYRIETDGIALQIAEDLDSLYMAIEIAEIFERFVHFRERVDDSLKLIDNCLQFLMKNQPCKVVDSTD